MHIDRLAGTELSPSVLAATKELLPTELGRPVELVEAAADALPFPDQSFDVVLAGACLLCIGPAHIEKSLREICRVSKRWLVLAEPFEDRRRYATAEGRIDPYSNTTYWIRNYPEILWHMAGAKQHSVVRLTEQEKIGHLDSITVIDLQG